MPKSTYKIHLLVIDGQVDFMDLPGSTLPVTGAVADAKRTAAMIGRLGGKIDDMTFTLDSHHQIHVANPFVWVDSDGQHPAPFTMISVDDVANGRWRARNPSWQKWQAAYVETLAKNGRYALVIWPPHCIIGTAGYALEPTLAAALLKWEREYFGMASMVTKGSNFHTEHYSAVQAEVVDPGDPTTSLNTDLISTLQAFDIVLLAGQALSHCVANTVRDIADNFGAANIEKLHLLTDCSSPVTGFEALGQQFIADMTARGMKTVASTGFLA